MHRLHEGFQRRLEVEDFHAIGVNDIQGNDFYVEGQKKYRRD